jgi:hypothetical protein
MLRRDGAQGRPERVGWRWMRRARTLPGVGLAARPAAAAWHAGALLLAAQGRARRLDVQRRA